MNDSFEPPTTGCDVGGFLFGDFGEMKRVFVLIGILATTTAHAKTCGMAEYLNGDVCTPIDAGYYGVGCRADLPDEYTELEYIESTGTQYINTKVESRNYYKYQVTAQLISDPYLTKTAIFGGWTGSQYAELCTNPNTKGWIVQWDRHFYGFSIKDTDKHTHILDVPNSRYTIDSLSYRIPAISSNSGADIYLFASNDNNSAIRMTALKLFDFSVYDASEEHIRDMVPARRDADGEIGMYDLINDVFYTNAGTGKFIPGPACPYQAQCEIGTYCIDGVRYDCENLPINATYTTAAWTTPTCPWICNDGFVRTIANTCNTLCPAGATTLRTDTGVNVPLFAERNTTPSINIGFNNAVCYVDLIPGTATGAINIEYDGKTYHTVAQ